MEKYVDQKVTIWTRIHFDNEADMEKIINSIKEKGFNSIFDETLGYKETEPLYDSEESMKPAENKNLATIQVCSDDKIIWDNTDIKTK